MTVSVIMYAVLGVVGALGSLIAWDDLRAAKARKSAE